MLKPKNPWELAVDLLSRSICLVQVASCIADNHGIFGWGWNGVHTGLGLCAERHAILRSNRRRLRGSTIYVAARWKDGKVCNSKPCSKCQALIDKFGLNVVYRNAEGIWKSGL